MQMLRCGNISQSEKYDFVLRYFIDSSLILLNFIFVLYKT